MISTSSPARRTAFAPLSGWSKCRSPRFVCSVSIFPASGGGFTSALSLPAEPVACCASQSGQPCHRHLLPHPGRCDPEQPRQYQAHVFAPVSPLPQHRSDRRTGCVVCLRNFSWARIGPALLGDLSGRVSVESSMEQDQPVFPSRRTVVSALRPVRRAAQGSVRRARAAVEIMP